jgi:hypothetical protein
MGSIIIAAKRKIPFLSEIDGFSPDDVWTSSGTAAPLATTPSVRLHRLKN